MIKLGATIGACIIAVIAFFLNYAGMFDRLELTREPCGPYTLVYREYRGPYNGVRYVMNTVYRYVRDTLCLETGTGFAVFYDDPERYSGDELRSCSGVIVSDSIGVTAPYKCGCFRRTDAVVGSIRLRSFFSYAVGAYRFYSRLPRFTEEKKIRLTGPVLERYDMDEKKIVYIAPVDRSISPAPEFGGE